MGDAALVTDADLARARLDPAFRHRLVAESLDLLLSELRKMRTRPGADDRQIREGAHLAVKLAELLQRVEATRGDGGDES
jgi:hypothetical protein